MRVHDPQLFDSAFQAKLDHVLADDTKRIVRLEHRGQSYWVKKSETLSLRWRLQKGDPRDAFRADVTGHHALAEAGVPVPNIIAEGDNFIVTQHSGRPLSDLLVMGHGSDKERQQAFHQAGVELARMHAKGLSHGRPAIKDMCWDGQALTFLDFERFSPARNTARGHMHDLIIMIHSCYAFLPRESDEARASANGYRTHDKTENWNRAQEWCHKMRWLDLVTKPLQWGTRNGAREFKAIPLTLAAFSFS